jgi:hypothetical protein
MLLKKSFIKGWLTRPDIWKNLAGLVTLASFLLPLALYCVVGLYTRYVADDYETAGSLTKYGFWGSQHFWYFNWSGRYSYFFIVNLFEILGVRAAPALTVVCLLLWFIALGWFIYQLLGNESVLHPHYLACLGAALILVVTLRSMDHIHQILFWVTGILTYTTYLILLTFFIGWIVNHLRHQRQFHWLEIIGAPAYVFVLTGFSEISAALQMLISLLVLVFFLFRHSDPQEKQSTLTFSGAILVSTLIGFALLFSAPGNTIRSALVPPQPGLYTLVLQSNINTVMFIATWVKDQTLLAGTAFLLPVIISFTLYQPPREIGDLVRRERAVLHGLLISLPLVYLILLSAFATSYYAISDSPPDRALVVPQYFLTIAIVLWGYWIGSLLKGALQPERNLPTALKVVGGILLVLMLLYVPLYSSAYIYTMIEPARTRAIEWDERDQIIRQAVQEDERNVVVWYIHDLNRLGDYSSDPNFLVNRAAADYYGLDTIIALDKRP